MFGFKICRISQEHNGIFFRKGSVPSIYERLARKIFLVDGLEILRVVPLQTVSKVDLQRINLKHILRFYFTNQTQPLLDKMYNIVMRYFTHLDQKRSMFTEKFRLDCNFMIQQFCNCKPKLFSQVISHKDFVWVSFVVAYVAGILTFLFCEWAK